MFDISQWLSSQNQVVKAIAGVVVVAIIIALITAGVGAIGTVLLFLLVCMVAYFGAIRHLAGSAVLAILLKTMSDSIQSMLSIFVSAPWVENFFHLVRDTGLTQLIFTLFFFFYLVSFGTGSVKLFNINTNVTNETKQRENKSEH